VIIKDNNSNSNQKLKIIIILLLLITIVSLSATFYFIFLKDNSNSWIDNNGNYIQEVEKNPDSISIPGYESITLKANTKKQTIALQNPEKNLCLFVIKLYLEDGTLIYESDYIKPGKVSKQIILKQPLVEGVYPNSILEYSCFKMDSKKTPLNGAKTKLTLYVKE